MSVVQSRVKHEDVTNLHGGLGMGTGKCRMMGGNERQTSSEHGRMGNGHHLQKAVLPSAASAPTCSGADMMVCSVRDGQIRGRSRSRNQCTAVKDEG
jgi:hypothetical protein